MNQEPKGGAAGAVEHLTAQPIERRTDWTGQAGAAAAGSLAPERREAVREAVATALGDAYDCTRHWSAWHMGTMTSDDFTLVADQDARLDEIVDALLGALPAPSAKQEPESWDFYLTGILPWSHRIAPNQSQEVIADAMQAELNDLRAALRKAHEFMQLAAPSASASPAASGFVLVPVDPTREMLQAASANENCGYGSEHFRRAYKAMLAAAPAVPVPAEQPEQPDDFAEGIELLESLIDNLAQDGNYSAEATLTFLSQIKQCLVPAAQSGAPAAPSLQQGKEGAAS